MRRGRLNFHSQQTPVHVRVSVRLVQRQSVGQQTKPTTRTVFIGAHRGICTYDSNHVTGPPGNFKVSSDQSTVPVTLAASTLVARPRASSTSGSIRNRNVLGACPGAMVAWCPGVPSSPPNSIVYSTYGSTAAKQGPASPDFPGSPALYSAVPQPVRRRSARGHASSACFALERVQMASLTSFL